jgi:hypothetical protein
MNIGLSKKAMYVHNDFRYLHRLRWALCSIFTREFFQSIEDVVSSNQLAEDSVLVVKIWCSFECDIKLRPVVALVSETENKVNRQTHVFVPAPLLAMATIPRLSCLAAPLMSCSSRKGVPQCDSPPEPVPVGSPVCTYGDMSI